MDQRGDGDPGLRSGVAWSGVRVEQRRLRRRDLGRAQSSLLSCDDNCGPMLLAVSDLTTTVALQRG